MVSFVAPAGGYRVRVERAEGASEVERAQSCLAPCSLTLEAGAWRVRTSWPWGVERDETVTVEAGHVVERSYEAPGGAARVAEPAARPLGDRHAVVTRRRVGVGLVVAGSVLATYAITVFAVGCAGTFRSLGTGDGQLSGGATALLYSMLGGIIAGPLFVPAGALLVVTADRELALSVRDDRVRVTPAFAAGPEGAHAGVRIEF